MRVLLPVVSLDRIRLLNIVNDALSNVLICTFLFSCCCCCCCCCCFVLFLFFLPFHDCLNIYFLHRSVGGPGQVKGSFSEATGLKAPVVSCGIQGSSTTDAYRRAFFKWRNFTRPKDEVQEFPAKTEHVALYIQHLMDTTRSHTAVDSAIYAIQWVHGLAGIPSPTDSPIIIEADYQKVKRNSSSQRHSRWKTVSAKNGYVDDNLESRLTVSKMLGI